MSNYYKNMNTKFKNAVNTIKKYCQFEDCDEVDCNNCPYPLSVIRCGDSINKTVPTVEKFIKYVLCNYKKCKFNKEDTCTNNNINIDNCPIAYETYVNFKNSEEE